MQCSLQIQNTLVSPNGTTIVLVNCLGTSKYTKAVLKIPYLASTESRLQNNVSALRWTVNPFVKLGKWSKIAPLLLSEGRVDGRVYSVEEHVEGVEAQLWNKKSQLAAMEYLHEFLEALANLSGPEQTASTLVEQLYGDKFIAVKHLLQPSSAQHLQLLWEITHKRLHSTKIPLVPRHGDFKLENALGNPIQPRSLRVLDWELWSEQGLPLLDSIHLLLSRRRRECGASIGAAIRRWLLHGGLDSTEKRLLQGLTVSLDPEYVNSIPFLYWLDCTGPIALQGQWPSGEWARRNVYEVLAELDGADAEVWA